MNEEKLNPYFDINAKYEDMILRGKSIVEHYLSVSDGDGEAPDYICLAYDVKNYLPKLQQKNQQLKELVNGIGAGRDYLFNKLTLENQQLKEENEELKLQNFNLREDIMIQKKSFPNKEIKDKTFFDLYDMLTYEQLKDRIDKAIEIAYTIEHNLDKYEEIGTEEHLEYAQMKIKELSEKLKGEK